MAIREDMVKRAVGFLRHPKVTGAPQDKQIKFLTDKNLTTEVCAICTRTHVRALRVRRESPRRWALFPQ